MRLARAVSVFLATVGLSVAALGTAALARDGTTAESYRELARQVSPAAENAPEGRGAEAAEEGGVDWEVLLAQNPSAVAWLRVAGSTVDVPVLSSTEGDPEQWLYTDLWGNPSDTGTPYLDHRCQADGELMVVYGHRTAYESYLFHDVSPLWEQEALDAAGEATWETRTSGTTTFRPLCAASVRMDDARWQPFSAKGADELREWLVWAFEEADAVRSDARPLVTRASRALVLVTCNGRAFHPVTRTIAVFVA